MWEKLSGGALFQIHQESNTAQNLTQPRVRSNWLSKRLRKFCKRRTVSFVTGCLLAAGTITLNIITPPSVSGDLNDPVIEVISLSPNALALTTTQSLQYPLSPNVTIINQNFNSWHPGVDFDGDIGDPVYPITTGKVKNIYYQRYAYGNHIIVDHGQGLDSLYAHLSKIDVVEGQIVDLKTVIGKVGTTGQSTGAHLHLEVIDQNRRINPLSFLGPQTDKNNN